jgi:hypothetical protein
MSSTTPAFGPAAVHFWLVNNMRSIASSFIVSARTDGLSCVAIDSIAQDLATPPRRSAPSLSPAGAYRVLSNRSFL